MAKSNSPSPKPVSPSSQGSDSSEAAAGDFPEFLTATARIPETISEDPEGDAGAAPGGGSDPSDLIAPELIASALGPSLQAAFHFVATKRGAHWELAAFEKTALIAGWTPILQYLLAKLGSQEQVMLTLAIMSTTAIVAGKAAQDIKRASSMVNTRMRESADSSAFSASEAAARPPEPSNSYEPQFA